MNEKAKEFVERDAEAYAKARTGDKTNMGIRESPELLMSGSREASLEANLRVEIVSDETHGPLCKRFMAGEKMPCFLGLSPETSYSNRAHLKTILEWLGPRSERIVVLEGSYFSRWDLMVFSRLSQGEAEQQVLRSVQRFERRLREVSTTLGLAAAVSPLQWPGVLESTETRSIESALRAYAQKSAWFSAGVDAILAEFLIRARSSARHSPSPNERSLLKNYIFEELSVFLHLCRSGYALEVYPGSDLDIMQRIAASAYADFPISCPNRSHLSIRLVRNR